MHTKFLMSPAYLASVAAMLVGALLAGTDYMMIGWISFIIGLALNAMALVVLANREVLHRASTVGVLPRPKKATDASPAQKDSLPVEETVAQDHDNQQIFPAKK